MYDYFYGSQSEQFAFYRIPKVLFTEPRFKALSTDAKALYGILLDRMNLSAKNGWIDKKGRVYIIFTTEEIMEAMGCANQKATRLLAELEKDIGLIERKRQGLGKPNLIYVKNFIISGNLQESHFLNHENHDSGSVKITDQESWKSQGNNTDINNTEMSDTDLFFSTSGRTDEMRTRSAYEEYFRDSLEIDILKQNNPGERDTLDGILDLLVDTCCANKPWIVISGDKKPIEVVKSRFMKLNSSHIEYVLRCLSDNTTRIRNVNQYLLATLYNASTTISPYYRSWVNNDMLFGIRQLLKRTEQII